MKLTHTNATIHTHNNKTVRLDIDGQPSYLVIEKGYLDCIDSSWEVGRQGKYGYQLYTITKYVVILCHRMDSWAAVLTHEEFKAARRMCEPEAKKDAIDEVIKMLEELKSQ